VCPESCRLLVVVPPTREKVLEATEYTASKDAPIIAAAPRAGVDYLVSVDRQHLAGAPVVAERSGLKIVPPSELLRVCRGTPPRGMTGRWPTEERTSQLTASYRPQFHSGARWQARGPHSFVPHMLTQW
jgi:hypothetical protein